MRVLTHVSDESVAVGAEGLEVGRVIICEVVVDVIDIELAWEKCFKSAALAHLLKVLTVLLLGA